MERSALSKLSDLRDHLTQLQLQATVQREIFEVLEELESRLYAAEQDNNLLKGKFQASEARLQSLETRYSQVLYALSDRRRG